MESSTPSMPHEESRGTALPADSGRIRIEVSNRQAVLPMDADSIRDAVATVLRQHAIRSAHVHVALVDNAEIRRLNRQFLQHDYATDVLSFCYEPPPELEGELVIGAEQAWRVANEKRIDPGDELVWYVVHGTVHLLGYDDATDELRACMRELEGRAMRALGRSWPLEDGGTV